MYEADPRSKPRTNSRLNSDGCHAASGNTRFGKNRVVSPEIWVTRASTPNRVSRIRWDCSRQTRSSTNSKRSDKFCAWSSLRVKSIDASSASVVLKALLAEITPSQTRMDSELHRTGFGQYHACERV